jgi:arylsulfatase A-like enzyme
MTFLYAQIPQEDTAIVLTSDSGMAVTERENSDLKRFNTRQFEIIMNAFLSARYGQDSWILGYADGSLYLNHDIIYSRNKSLAEVQNELANFALQYRGVAAVSTATGMRSAQFSRGVLALVQNGYHHRRSGDVVIALEPERIETDSKRVSMSGSAYSYDRHVPFVVYGAGIAPRRVSERVSTDQIASTLAELLGVNRPMCSDVETLKLGKKK